MHRASGTRVARKIPPSHPFVGLDLEPGDLQLFEGRHSMHRITPPVPGSWRRIALLSCCEEPGVIGRTNRTFKSWKRDP